MTMSIRSLTWWLLFAATACSKTTTSADTPAGPATPSASPAPAPTPSPSQACSVRLAARLDGKRGGTFKVTVALHNGSDRAFEIDLADRCPQGLVDFTGLRAGYDYYDSCNKGACPGNRPPHHVELAPGESRDLVTLGIVSVG